MTSREVPVCLSTLLIPSAPFPKALQFTEDYHYEQSVNVGRRGVDTRYREVCSVSIHGSPFCGLHVVFIAYNKRHVHSIADTCCTPLGFHIVLSITALRYQAHAVSFRVETLVSLDKTQLRYNPQDNDLYTVFPHRTHDHSHGPQN